MTIVSSWTSLPEAAALLARCAENPPRLHEFTYLYGDKDSRYVDRIEWTDKPVRRLNRLRRDAMDAALVANDRAAAEAIAALTVTAAIDQAIDGKSERRIAA